MSKPCCPVCKSDAAVAFSLRKSDCDIQHCADCDHFFVSPVPDDEALRQLYTAEAGYMAHEDGGEREFSPKFARRLEHIRGLRQGGRILDVGCAAGDFLILASRAGFEVQGVEMNPDTAALARAAGIPVEIGALEEAPLREGSFDIVHLGDVIEHVSDPASLVRQARRMLAPGGLLVVTTPNHDAFFPRATYALYRWLRVPWSHPTPPFHLQQFSRRSLARMLEDQGFRQRDVYYESVGIGYEIRATLAPQGLKRAVQGRDWRGVARHGFATAGVCATYPCVRLMDRLRPAGRPDATINVLASLEGEATS